MARFMEKRISCLLVQVLYYFVVSYCCTSVENKKQQNRNAQEIANRGAELYNKLSGFVDDLNMLGKTPAAGTNRI